MFQPGIQTASTLALLALAVSSVSAQSLLPQYGVVVAELGDSPAGLAPGEVFGTTSPFDNPVMSANGTVLFRGRLAAGGTVTTANDRALFLGRSKADLAMIVRANDVDPSGTYPNSVLQQVSSGTGNPLGSNLFSSQRISPNGGFILFGAQLYDQLALDGIVNTTAGGTINDTVLYHGTPGNLQILAQRNTTLMPGGAVLSSAFSSLSQQATALNSNGVAVFKSDLSGGDVTGADNDSAWIVGLPGNLSYFLREGDAVLGGANVIPAGGLGFNCTINDQGWVLHDEKLSLTQGTSPATAADDQVAFISIGGVHFLLMREGTDAPDATGAPMVGTLYGVPTLAQGFGNSGTAAFQCSLNGSNADTALFIGDISLVQLVARAGDVVPGTGGETLNVINSSTGYSENGGLVFGATLVQPGTGGVTNLNDSVLCIADRNQPLQLLVREGDACPGLPGFVFGNLSGSSNFGSSSGHRINDRGQVLFSLSVNNGVDSPSATYSWDPVRGLELQLLGNSTLGDVFGGGTVTLGTTPIQFPSGDGNTLGFNGNGEFAMRVSITAPSGNFIVRGAVGGAITPSTTTSLCPSPATLQVTGSPNLGDMFTVDVIGATGLPFTGYGLAPQLPLPLPCGCSVISDGAGGLGDFAFTASRALTIPYSTFFLGVEVELQGIDAFPTSGGCSLSGIPFGLTDVWTLTIG
ncbi:MAG: choice-of-anchor tandem repeat NxxGxxAF-containing protein [Planctomycetota bacterium]